MVFTVLQLRAISTMVLRMKMETDRRLEVRQISIGILSRSTISRAAGERKVAWPRRDGPKDSKVRVSSSVFSNVCEFNAIMGIPLASRNLNTNLGNVYSDAKAGGFGPDKGRQEGGRLSLL